MYLQKKDNESLNKFKLRYLNLLFNEIKSKFPLRHTFVAMDAEKPVDEKYIPANGSVLCLTGKGVYYCFVPYCEPGSASHYHYRLNNIYEFIEGPLKSNIVTSSAPYDLMEINNLPSNLASVVERLSTLKQAMKESAKNDINKLKFGNETASSYEIFQSLMEECKLGNFNAFDDYMLKSKEFSDYAKEVTPDAKAFLTEQLKELANSSLVHEINEVVFDLIN